MARSRSQIGIIACEYTSSYGDEVKVADQLQDSACKMKNMILPRNSKNTWPVPCVEITVSTYLY